MTYKLCILAGVVALAVAWSSHDTKHEVYFSPRGVCTEAIVREIGQAKREVLLQGYGFTSAPILEALVAAKHRKLVVRAVLDRTNLTDHDSLAPQLERSGAETTFDKAHAIAHNKTIVIDGRTVITGSFNWTVSAEERNAENVLIIRDTSLAAAYRENWLKHREHSKMRE